MAFKRELTKCTERKIETYWQPSPPQIVIFLMPKSTFRIRFTIGFDQYTRFLNCKWVQFEIYVWTGTMSLHRLLIICNGRLAKHVVFLTKYFSQSIQVQFWDRKLEQQNPGMLENCVSCADFIWILIKDDTIESFYQEKVLPYLRKEALVAHSSGSRVIENVIDIHPLMSFGPEYFTKDVYIKIPIITSSSPELATKFLEGIGFFFWSRNLLYIQKEQKSYYHALCVMANNFPIMLWTEVTKCAQNLGLPENLFHSIIKQGAENFLNHPKLALTGPLVRKDTQTIQLNLNALHNNSNQLESLYRSFVQFYELTSGKDNK